MRMLSAVKASLVLCPVICPVICPLVCPAVAGAPAYPGGELRRHCAAFPTLPDSKAATQCAAYVRGFLDGVRITDERTAAGTPNTYQRAESFTQRAARQRLGSRVSGYRPGVYADFCIGAAIAVEDVMRALNDHLQAQPPAPEATARDALYRFLIVNYPCR